MGYANIGNIKLKAVITYDKNKRQILFCVTAVTLLIKRIDKVLYLNFSLNSILIKHQKICNRISKMLLVEVTNPPN